MRTTHYPLVALVAGALLAPPSQAQGTGTVFEEIIVTAQKREQSIYDVPVAITAFSGEDLAKQGIGNLRDVGNFVPNLNVTNFSAGQPASVNPFIRGIGIQDHLITTDPGVSVYIDGVYLGRQIGQNWSLADIERIEVLRGPQGTLYGRNSIGGAINLITRKPGDGNTLRGGIEVGSRGRVNADVYGNYRINEQLAISASGAYLSRDGLGDFVNLNTDVEVGETEDISGRIAVNWTPTERLRVLFTADANDGNGGLNPYTTFLDQAPNFPLAPGLTNDALAENLAEDNNRFDNATGQAELADVSNNSQGVSLTVEYDFNEYITAKVLASHRRSEYEAGLDDDSTELNFAAFPETGFANQESVELQVNGTYDQWEFVAGAYYFDEIGMNAQPNATFFFGPSEEFLSQEADSWAVYANASYQWTPRLNVSAGIRYGEDDKDASVDVGLENVGGPNEVTASESFDEVTWDVQATYDVTDNISVYGKVATGYQSGQFNPRPFCLFGDFFVAGGGTMLPADNCFDQDLENITATNFEGGIRGTFFGRVRASLTVFHTMYEDLPYAVSNTTAQGFNTVNIIVDQDSTGVEFEGSWNVFDRFFLNASFGYIDVDVDETDDAPDVAAPLTPELTASVSPEYSFPFANGEVNMRLDYSFRDNMFGEPTSDPRNLTNIGSRFLLNFDVSYTSADQSWTAGVYGRNITDERYENARLNTGDYIIAILANDASEFGFRANKRFDF